MHQALQDKDQLIVALDVSNQDEALRLVDSLEPYVGYFKVGLQLFSRCGPGIVSQILDRGGRVFLDLKLHDIPNTVAKAATEITGLGVQMLTLHTQGGLEMLKRAGEAVSEESLRLGVTPPLLLGVTILTSLNQDEIERTGYQIPLENLVVRLAGLAVEAGIGGIVCSPQELELLNRSDLDLHFVTPGIRPEGLQTDDQSRTLPPSKAIRLGASFLVVGRPITTAADPAAAARSILGEIARARMAP